MTGATRPSKDAVNAIFGEEMPRTTKDEREGNAPDGGYDGVCWAVCRVEQAEHERLHHKSDNPARGSAKRAVHHSAKENLFDHGRDANREGGE